MTESTVDTLKRWEHYGAAWRLYPRCLFAAEPSVNAAQLLEPVRRLRSPRVPGAATRRRAVASPRRDRLAHELNSGRKDEVDWDSPTPHFAG